MRIPAANALITAQEVVASASRMRSISTALLDGDRGRQLLDLEILADLEQVGGHLDRALGDAPSSSRRTAGRNCRRRAAASACISSGDCMPRMVPWSCAGTPRSARAPAASPASGRSRRAGRPRCARRGRGSAGCRPGWGRARPSPPPVRGAGSSSAGTRRPARCTPCRPAPSPRRPAPWRWIRRAGPARSPSAVANWTLRVSGVERTGRHAVRNPRGHAAATRPAEHDNRRRPDRPIAPQPRPRHGPTLADRRSSN